MTTGQPITVTMSGGRASWEPSGAVVFIGADAGGGPSAECCCDYLNFFADRDAAQAWASAHPRVPVQILDQAEAEDLGGRLFGHLLATTSTNTNTNTNTNANAATGGGPPRERDLAAGHSTT